MILKRFSFWLAIAGVLLALFALWGARTMPPSPPPLEPPPTNPYRTTVAASGIIEAVNENVRIAPAVPGLVTRVHVAVGDHVKPGDPLFQLDDRELRARLRTRQDAIPSVAARIQEQTILLRNLKDQLGRLQAVEDQRAVSEDDIRQKWHEVEGAKRALLRAKADLRLARTQRDEAGILLERLTVHAPRAGTILQVDVRAGEYATVGTRDAYILLGDTDTLQVRADIDEVNAPLLQPDRPAVAYMKGDTEHPIPLNFARIEPYIVPKRSLTGDNRERVDTRVLQVIYHFDKPSFPIYVGQQVDVFIERRSEDPADGETGREEGGQ